VIGIILIAALLSPLIAIPGLALGWFVRNKAALVALGAVIAVVHALIASTWPPAWPSVLGSLLSTLLWTLLGALARRLTQ